MLDKAICLCIALLSIKKVDIPAICTISKKKKKKCCLAS